MTYRLALKIALERAGFKHVAGWAREGDAPEIQAKIDAARPDVDAVKAEREAKG